jgi:hypothetical protein
MRWRDQLVVVITILWSGSILYWASTLGFTEEDFNEALRATPAPTEEKLIQKLPKPKVRFTVEQEIQMACLEADCVRKCNAQYPDKKEKFDSCRKQCAKDRCRDRCKGEPNPSYVERELKREKCLDKCSDKDEKCKQYCEEESRRCKDRCKERAHRYFCVRDLDKLGQDDEPEFDPATLLTDSDLI